MGVKKIRRKFTANFKAKVAIAAIKEQMSLAELSKKYSLHVNQISKWKKEFLDNSSKIFDDDGLKNKEAEKERDRLFRKVGELEMERDFLKKNLERIEA